MEKVLVTGAEGFIGSHLVETLVRLGYRVRAFVWYRQDGSIGNLLDLPQEVLSEVEVVHGDIRDRDVVRSSVRNIDGVFNLAALIGIPYSYDTPDAYVETNIRGTLNILQSCRDEGCSRVVVISTSEVYGSAQFVPITEAHPLNAQSPYAATKIAADQLALSFYRSYGLPVTVVRPFNTYGPRQSLRAVIPTIVSQLLHNPNYLELGALYPTRDLTFVEDTARGIAIAGKAEGVEGEVINLGMGFEISIGELAKVIADLLECSPDIVEKEERLRPQKSEVERLIADTTLARRLLGWVPEYVGEEGLRSGISRTIEWLQKNHLVTGDLGYRK